MGRRGNPYYNAMMEILIKTLKVEGVYPLKFEIAEDVEEQLLAFIEKDNALRLHSSLGYLSPEQYKKGSIRVSHAQGLLLGFCKQLQETLMDREGFQVWLAVADGLSPRQREEAVRVLAEPASLAAVVALL